MIVYLHILALVHEIPPSVVQGPISLPRIFQVQYLHAQLGLLAECLAGATPQHPPSPAYTQFGLLTPPPYPPPPTRRSVALPAPYPALLAGVRWLQRPSVQASYGWGEREQDTVFARWQLLQIACVDVRNAALTCERWRVWARKMDPSDPSACCCARWHKMCSRAESMNGW
jgi:hypothetical protein